MRHQKNKMTRAAKTASGKSLIVNLAESLVLYEKISTTKAKAKAVKSFTDKLITVSKRNNLTARRELVRKLYTGNAVKKLMEVLGPRYAERRGGYTRMTLITGNRTGDGAERTIVELIK